MKRKEVLQITFGNIYEKSDGYKIRGELIHRFFSEQFKLDTVQIVEDQFSDLNNCIVARSWGSKIIALLFSPLLLINKIAESDYVLIEGSMFLCFALAAKLLGKKVIFDPQGVIAALGKREQKNIYNIVFRLLIGNVLDFVMAHVSDFSIFVSNEDMGYFIKNYGMPKETAKLVRMVIEEPKNCHKIIKIKNQLVFIGDLKAIQNRSAVQYIMEKVAPNLGNYEFIIIGRGNDNFDNNLNNVKFTGFVEDPNGLICSSSIAIVPLLSGTGVKTKILYFLSLGIPVITTNIGAEGLININDILNKGLFLSDLDHFQDKIVTVCSISENIDSEYLRNYVKVNHSIDSMRKDIENLITDMVILKD